MALIGRSGGLFFVLYIFKCFPALKPGNFEVGIVMLSLDANKI
ncbi:hypothetical protein SBF1_3850002 [Candidatus Desulfosporosinus infrequens]|uniref:Uncharacterized protein n=1 Tax=Candidatus Desulfosporosinus infrequens TaxID=2043169 RepID=A0A2U3L625_9FIRM|nr:hypothetical protein SBF1_3850002 [Candidatus Desulfosporosinus infrequens]